MTTSKAVEPLFAGHRYSELIGCLIYLACGTRPDIAFAVHSLTCGMHSPLINTGKQPSTFSAASSLWKSPTAAALSRTWALRSTDYA